MSEASPAEAVSRWWRPMVVLQLALGASLVAFVLSHGRRHWAALGGRHHWALSVGLEEPGPLAGWSVVLAVVYLGLGGVLWLAQGRLRAPVSPVAGQALARRLSAVMAATCAAFHLSQSWPGLPGPHRGAYAGYDTLMAALGQPSTLVVYVVGVTATAVHLALGLDWAAHELGLGSLGRRAVAAARLVGGAVSIALWLAALHLLGHFANGEGLLP